VSYYEADAFARWAGAAGCPPNSNGKCCQPGAPVQAICWGTESFILSPAPSAPENGQPLQFLAMSGNGAQRLIWLIPLQALLRAALGEYNGKFMSGQMVTCGADRAPRRVRSYSGHVLSQLLPAETRWQFSG